MELIDRLSKLEKRLEEEDFIHNRGLGNEVPFYIFQYNPKDEMRVRYNIKNSLMKRYDKESEIKVLELDLYELFFKIMKDKNYFEKIFLLEKKNGSSELVKGVRNSFSIDAIIKHIKSLEEKPDIIFLTGLGKIYPMVAVESLLSNLQTVLTTEKVIAFFPGEYTGKELILFGKERLKVNYYRAFSI